MKTFLHTATLPDGTTFTRRNKKKPYTHFIAVKYLDKWFSNDDRVGTWQAFRWTSWFEYQMDDVLDWSQHCAKNGVRTEFEFIEPVVTIEETK